MTAILAQPLAVTATGAVSPVGATAAQTCASIRGGLAGFSEHPFLESVPHDPEWEEGEPLLCARVPNIDPDAEAEDRLIELAVPTLREVARQAGLKRSDLRDMTILVALPTLDASVRDWNLESTFAERLRLVSGIAEIGDIELRHGGHTSVFELAAEACGLLSQGAARFCLILGIDTFLSPDRAELWDDEWRLRGERNVDGFIPGEASCAILLELPQHATERGQAPLAIINAVGVSTEPNPMSGEEASTGSGLCTAIRDVLSSDQDARWICCDLNGESYRAFEWGVAQVRLASELGTDRLLHHPADCTGDVGAATGALLIALAAHGFDRSQRLPRSAVLWTSSDDGRRAAVRVSTA